MNKQEREFLELRPSALLTLALQDLEMCERDPRYEVDMGDWHRPYDETCAVCLAGSVIAQTFETDWYVDVSPMEYYPKPIADRLEALDDFRCGYVVSAVNGILGTNTLNILVEERLEAFEWNLVVPQYRDDPRGFKGAMNHIVAELQEYDL